MRKPESYMKRLNGSLHRIVTEIVREAQADAYQDGYRAASEQLFRIANETNDRVDKIIDSSHGFDVRHDN